VGSVRGIDITCTDISIIGQDLAAYSGGILKRTLLFSRQVTVAAEEAAAVSYYNALKTACQCHNAGIAFGVIAWYATICCCADCRLLWSVTLGYGCYHVWTARFGGDSRTGPSMEMRNVNGEQKEPVPVETVV
jgi:hypothetical protein